MAEALTNGTPSIPSQSELSPLNVTPSPAVPPVVTNFSDMELVMFEKIIATGCIIQSQQRGEPDLSHTEKCKVLYSILHTKPGAFLMRFGKCLDEADLMYFDGLTERDFEVGFRVKELRKKYMQSQKTAMKKVKNRRYEYLKQLMAESSYFSEEEMRERDPLLFEYYIGQFMTDDEKAKMDGNVSDMTLSSMILKKMGLDRRAALLEYQQMTEMGQDEEFDSSSNEDDSEEDETDSNRGTAAMLLSSDPEVAEREKSMLRQEFLATMQARFIDGKEVDFDYTKVDSDERYDSLYMREKDDQDEYFDQEEPSWCDVDETDICNNQMQVDATNESKEPGRHK